MLEWRTDLFQTYSPQFPEGRCAGYTWNGQLQDDKLFGKGTNAGLCADLCLGRIVPKASRKLWREGEIGDLTGKQVIDWIEKLSPVQLVAIGIGHDVTRYYRRAVTIMDVEQLGGAMIEQLAGLFEDE